MSILCTVFYRVFIALAAGLLSIPAYADTELPEVLLYQGKPIDPLCFELVSADQWTPLANCKNAAIVTLPDEPSPWLVGKIGYRYRYQQDVSNAVSYSYYEYIGMWNGAPVIASYVSGGGTGRFATLVSLEREGDKMRVLQGFAAGDRCNGGVVDAKIERGTLYYGQYMTPIDFLQIVEDNPHNLESYEDLEASASSCFAVARFEDEEFVGITLQDASVAQPEGEAIYKYQRCFNKIYKDYIMQDKKELSVDELKQFTSTFNRMCVVSAK